jgi:hypothetical protein
MRALDVLALGASVTVAAAASCGVPDFVFNGASSGSDRTMLTGTGGAGGSAMNSAPSASSASSSTGGGPSSASAASSTSASSTSAATSSSSGMPMTVPCYMKECATGEVCCVNSNNVDNAHTCKAPASCDTTNGYIPLSCQTNADCGDQEVCCADYSTHWISYSSPDIIFCTAKCDGSNQFPACLSKADCGGAACYTAFASSSPPYGACLPL